MAKAIKRKAVKKKAAPAKKSTPQKKSAVKKTSVKKKAAKKTGTAKNKLGVKNSLVNNINKRKAKGITRSKKKSTVSKKAYKKMQGNWGKS